MDSDLNRGTRPSAIRRRVSFAGFGGPAVILTSLFGAIAVGLTLGKIDYEDPFIFAYLTFLLLYLLLSALWGETAKSDIPLYLCRDSINPANRLIPLVLGGALLLLSHLGSDLPARILYLDQPLVGTPGTGFPQLLFATGVLLVCLPVVTLKPIGSRVVLRVNIAYPLFFVSFFLYLAISIFFLFWGEAKGYVEDIINSLLFISFVSGVVFTISEAMQSRRGYKKPGPEQAEPSE